MIKLGPGAYHGKVQDLRTFDDLTFSESHYSAGLDIPRHEHAHPFFCYVVGGVCTEKIGARSLTVRSSSLIYHPAELAHSNSWGSNGGRCFHFEIAPSRLERIREHRQILSDPVEFQGGLPSWLALQVYREFQQGDDCSPLVMEGLVLEVIAEASRRRIASRELRPPRWLSKARDFLDAHFSETLTLGEMAVAVGVDPDHMARVFRTHLGCTPGEYVRRLRVEVACQRISLSDMPLAEIALELGFSDQSHFTKVFKRITGTTPAEFGKRRLARRLRTKSTPSSYKKPPQH